MTGSKQFTRAELKTQQDKLYQTLNSLKEMARKGLPVAQAQAQIQEQLAAIEQQLAALSAASIVFDRRSQQVVQQINVAGDLVQQAVLLPTADPVALQRAYLHRLMQQTRRLPLAGVDLKATNEVESQELQLAAVYTALLTQRLEREEGMHEGRMMKQPDRETHHLSALERNV